MTRRTMILSTVALAMQGSSTGQDGVSLAAWSFSGSYALGKWKLLELPGILRDKLGITALEHVNTFFENPTLAYQQRLKKACADAGVRSTIIMCDNEGATASPDKSERRKAAIAHRKWIDIAHELGCISVRCNAYGGRTDWKQDLDLADRAAETFREMLDYAKGSELNILVENHGGASSDPDLLVALVKKVNHPKFALLCDLGNWNKGEDRYAAVRKILPFSRGLSVKGTWGERLDPAFDCEKLVRTALEGGYKGYWGLEITPRRGEGPALPAAEQFDAEVRTLLEAKAITERVVFGKS